MRRNEFVRSSVLAFTAASLAAALLFSSAKAQAQLVELDDPTLPASSDGFNLTHDLVTGLEWLDLTVTVGRSFEDLVGDDGTNEFAVGGDFEGFRHATHLELTGWTVTGQVDSLFSNFGITSTFNFIAGYAISQDLMSYIGCFQGCGIGGFAQGLYRVDFLSPPATGYGFTERYQHPGTGSNFGSIIVQSFASTSRPQNGSSAAFGHYLVRPVPEPALGHALLAGMIALVSLRRRQRSTPT